MERGMHGSNHFIAAARPANSHPSPHAEGYGAPNLLSVLSVAAPTLVRHDYWVNGNNFKALVQTLSFSIDCGQES
jgi:hypothetical protein